MRLVQLMGDNVEELWHFPDETTDEQIEQLYKDYLATEEDDDSPDFDSFEEYLDSLGEWAAVTERVFVDEIYV